MGRKHFISMNGSRGCLPDACDVSWEHDDAVSILADRFELDDERRKELADDDIISLTPEDGAEYAEITECTCSKPWEHQDGQTEEQFKKENEDEMDERRAVIVEYLDCEWDDVEPTSYDDLLFELGSSEYLVLTDSEADERAAAYVKDSLWAFNPSFLAGETSIDQDVYDAIANNGKCESNNDAILSLIKGTCGLDSFVESAISADGRGHFLSSYDGNENEQGDYFIYRVN